MVDEKEKKKAELIGDFIPEGSPDEDLVRKIDFTHLPQHIAIIMDGNGRWALQKGLSRIEGHRAGVEPVRQVVEASAHLGIKVLTLYAFSIENWKRPANEVATLMNLLREYLHKELKAMMDNNIIFHPIGRISMLPKEVVKDLKYVEHKTKENSGLQFNLALNYGGRTEIVDAVLQLYNDLEAKKLKSKNIDEELLSNYLYTKGQPDPDLLIRTSGEMRISNFLLWQLAYTEIWVTPTLWPDFSRTDLLTAIIEYQKRERRYGAI